MLISATQSNFFEEALKLNPSINKGIFQMFITTLHATSDCFL